MDRAQRLLAVIAVVFLAALAAGCGGGGGGGGSDDGLGYRGVTSKAVVGSGNAGEFCDATVMGSTIGVGLQDLSSAGGAALSRSVARGVVAKSVAAARSAGLTGLPISAEGDCGGQVSGTVAFRSGGFLDFDAELEFVQYCTDQTVIDGRINISSRLQPNDTVRIVETFAGLAIDDGEESLLLGGTITATGDVAGDSGTVTLDFVVEDLVSGAQAWFDNLVIRATDDLTSQSMALSGRVYHWQHGFVDLSTDAAGALAQPYTLPAGFVAPLVVPEGSDNPVSGGVLFVGENGTAAVLRALNEAQYDIIVDEGNGVFGEEADPVLGPFAWE